MSVVWRVTAEDIHHVLCGDQRAVEEMLRMLDVMALEGGTHLIRVRFPGPQRGGGFEFAVRRERWIGRLLWRLGFRGDW